MNNFGLQVCNKSPITWAILRNFSVSSASNKEHSLIMDRLQNHLYPPEPAQHTGGPLADDGKELSMHSSTKIPEVLQIRGSQEHPEGVVVLHGEGINNLFNPNSCKLLIVGGGSGGCTIAAKFAKRSQTKNSVIVLEPSQNHYYQPLWTLVGAGVKTLEQTRRDEKSVLPRNAFWIKDYAQTIDPKENRVTTKNGDIINYEYLVVAVGLKYDYEKIPGLETALQDPNQPVATIYDSKYAEKTWAKMKGFRGGDGIFTYPNTPIKCPGAPQKIAYLFDSYLEKTGRRSKATIKYNTFLPVIFGVKKYADQLLKVAARKQIQLNYKTVLEEVKPDQRVAVFSKADTNEKVEMNYDFLHAVPPMSTPLVLQKNTELADKQGFLSVDKYTLQHTKYKNIYGLGDCTSTPNSKTAAAIAKQCYTLEQNLVQTMSEQSPTHKYDGYGACPLLTSYGTCILAEFIYDGVVHETFPFDKTGETRIAYYMKKDMFPFIYWNFMLKGLYHGPEFVRKIANPFAK